MNRLIFTFLLLLSVKSFSQTTSDADAPSVHGMVLFGVNKIYASHMPMFHNPHDYQVLLELELDEKIKGAYLEDRKQNPQESVYTLEPEKFVLTDMIKHPVPFTANIYRGHFERGGKMLIEKITVKIAKVIYFKHFNPEDFHLDELNFIVLGNEKEQFMAHQISTSPDFDQLIAIKTGFGALRRDFNESGHLIITLPRSDNWKSLEIKDQIFGIVAGHSDTLAITPKKNLYLEFTDLK